MKLRDLIEEVTPSAVQDIQAGLNPKQIYLVQPRRWTVWLLRFILAVSILLAIVGIGATAFGSRADPETWGLLAIFLSPCIALGVLVWKARKRKPANTQVPNHWNNEDPTDESTPKPQMSDRKIVGIWAVCGFVVGMALASPIPRSLSLMVAETLGHGIPFAIVAALIGAAVQYFFRSASRGK